MYESCLLQDFLAIIFPPFCVSCLRVTPLVFILRSRNGVTDQNRGFLSKDFNSRVLKPAHSNKVCYSKSTSLSTFPVVLK